MSFLEKKATVSELLMDAIEKTVQDPAYHTPDSLAALARAFADVSSNGRGKTDPDKKRGSASIL